MNRVGGILVSISPQKKSLGVTDCKRNFVSEPSYQKFRCTFPEHRTKSFLSWTGDWNFAPRKICHSDGATTSSQPRQNP